VEVVAVAAVAAVAIDASDFGLACSSRQMIEIVIASRESIQVSRENQEIGSVPFFLGARKNVF
jgi:hypothetical protein